MQTLYTELRAERRLVAQLEAVLACGAADGTDGRSIDVKASMAGAAYAGGYPLPIPTTSGSGAKAAVGLGAADGVLSQLLDGLQLKQLEEQVHMAH